MCPSDGPGQWGPGPWGSLRHNPAGTSTEINPNSHNHGMLEVDGMVLPLGLLGMAQGLDLLLATETGSSIGALDSAGAQRNQEYGIWMQLLSTAGHADVGFAKAQAVPAACVPAARLCACFLCKTST